MKRNRKFLLTALLVGIVSCSWLTGQASAASSVKDLKENKTYQYNLDGKGKKEKISYTMTGAGTDVCVYKIKINGKVAKKIKLNGYYYNPRMQILDINKKSKGLDIWVYAYRDSEDICYSALYRYANNKLTKVWSPPYKSHYNDMLAEGNGFLSSTDGKGIFTVVVDRAVYCDWATGNHLDNIVYRLKNGKVSLETKRTVSFYQTYTAQNYVVRNSRWLKTARKTKFYTDHSKKSKTFTLKKGTQCYPLKAYVASNSKVFVQFKTKSGKKGWLCAQDYDYDRVPFSNMAFFD